MTGVQTCALPISSVDVTPQQKAAATKGESMDDPEGLSGMALLSKELGAEVIKVEEHE